MSQGQSLAFYSKAARQAQTAASAGKRLLGSSRPTQNLARRPSSGGAAAVGGGVAAAADKAVVWPWFVTFCPFSLRIHSLRLSTQDRRNQGVQSPPPLLTHFGRSVNPIPTGGRLNHPLSDFKNLPTALLHSTYTAHMNTMYLWPWITLQALLLYNNGTGKCCTHRAVRRRHAACCPRRCCGVTRLAVKGVAVYLQIVFLLWTCFWRKSALRYFVVRTWLNIYYILFFFTNWKS